MEVNISPEIQKAIEGLAAQNGTTPGDQAAKMLVDALQRETDYDQWFREKVREGIAAGDHGELVDHEQVRHMLKKRYTG